MDSKLSYEELIQKNHDLEAKINRMAKETSTGRIKALDMKENEVTSYNGEDLIVAKEMLQMVMDSIPQFIFWKNCNLVYLGCNRNFALAAGVGEPEAIKGKTDYDLAWKKEEADFFRACDRRVIENDQPEYHIIEPQFQAGGKQSWLDTNKIPLHNPDGTVIGILGTYEDITERVKTHNTLRLYEEILATTSDLMSIIDSDYVYLAVNDAYLNAHSKERDKIVGHTAAEILGTEFFEQYVKPNIDQALAGKMVNFDAWLDYPGIGKRFMHVCYYPHLDEDRDSKRVVVSAHDITLTHQLKNQLIQAQKMEAIGTLAGGIAHDFNNILFAIIGYTELVQQEVPLESSIGKYLEQVITSANRGADLVKQILAFSHKASHIKHTVPPHLIIKEAVSMLKSTLPKRISIEEDIDPACGMVLVDPTSLHQIVVNLCTNAIHAMVDKKGTLCVGLHRREFSAVETVGMGSLSPGPFAVLSVRDNGRGIDPTTIDRIFEPYFTTKALGRGTGLGLSIVQSAVRDCDGFIEVESSLGGGSTFTVYLPVSEESSVQTDISAQKGGIASLAGRERILVIDDELILVKINEQRLKNQGYRVTALSDSKEALDMFRCQPDSFDLLITDQTMPELTGMELVRAVQKIKPSIPIIMLTGHSTTFLEEEAKALGIKRCLTKPVSDIKLLITVREVLNAIEDIG